MKIKSIKPTLAVVVVADDDDIEDFNAEAAARFVRDQGQISGDWFYDSWEMMRYDTIKLIYTK